MIFIRRVSFLCLGLSFGIAPAQSIDGWSNWQRAAIIGLRTRCVVDPANKMHSLVDIQLENESDDEMIVKGKGVKKGDDVVMRRRIKNISYEGPKNCQQYLDSFRMSAEERPWDGSYRIEYKQGILQVGYHGSIMMAVGAAMQGAAAGMSGAPPPSYPTPTSSEPAGTDGSASAGSTATSVGGGGWKFRNDCIKESHTSGKFQFINACDVPVYLSTAFKFPAPDSCWTVTENRVYVAPGGNGWTGNPDPRVVETIWNAVYVTPNTAAPETVAPLVPPSPHCQSVPGK